MLAKVGIKVKPKLVEVTVLTDLLQKGEHQSLISSSLTGPDSLATLQCFYSKTPRTACRYTDYNSPAFDKLFEDAAASLDPAKRVDLLRNALVLIVTIVGLQFGSLMGQAVVVEKLFAWPGVGSLMVDSVFQRDMPAVQGCILMIVVFFLVINTMVDLAYVAIDPRIRYG